MRCIGAICGWAKGGVCTAVYIPDKSKPRCVMVNPSYGQRVSTLSLKMADAMCSEWMSVKDRAERTP